MRKPETFNIEGKRYTLSEVIKGCEAIAMRGQGVFVGREAIRGRLKCGIRTWAELVQPVKSHRERAKNHVWRTGRNTNTPKKPRKRHTYEDTVPDADPYTGADEPIEALIGVKPSF